MNKQVIGLLLALGLTAILGACGGENTTPVESPVESPIESPTPVTPPSP